MNRTFQTKTEADNLIQVSIFQLNQDNRLGKYPFRLEILNDIGELEKDFSLISTDCYFGGKSYWIKCHCGRRVGIIYRSDGYFACRYCHNLTYYSRNLKRSLRSNPLFKLISRLAKSVSLTKNPLVL